MTASLTSYDQLNQPGVKKGVASDTPEYVIVETEYSQAEQANTIHVFAGREGARGSIAGRVMLMLWNARPLLGWSAP